jgi:hypothetical protein
VDVSSLDLPEPQRRSRGWSKAQIDGALLDAKLIAGPVDEVASMLIQRDVPFAVLTAYVGEMVPAVCRGAPTLAKPFTEARSGVS